MISEMILKIILTLLTMIMSVFPAADFGIDWILRFLRNPKKILMMMTKTMMMTMMMMMMVTMMMMMMKMTV